MENYKRLVSYMYNYENGVKGSNVGYTKIENRNGQCKITIHMRVLSLSEKQMSAFIFHRKEEEMICIPLGAPTVKNGVCECRIITQTADVMNSGYTFDEMGGLILYVSDEKYFGTEWDDKPIDLKKVVVTTERKEEKPKIPEVMKVEAAQIPIIEPEQSQNEEEEITDSVEIKQEQEKPSLETENIKRDAVEAEKTVKVETESFSGQEEYLDNGKATYQKMKYRPDQIFERYPRMYPFEDDEVSDCVRIEPQDLGIFPMEHWVYANNSFLLHSYYSYRHLIFAKKKQSGQSEYLLGVPGIYHNREQFMARMFGFPNFKPIRNRELIPGEFGYWYFSMIL